VGELEAIQKEWELPDDATYFGSLPFEDAELLALLMDTSEGSRNVVVAEQSAQLKKSFLETDILAYKDHPKVGPKVRKLIEELGIEDESD